MSPRSPWSRTLRRLATRVGLRRGGPDAVAEDVGRWLDGEGHDRFERARVPGLAVAVRLRDGSEVARSFGSAGGVVPLGPDTLFQVLSLSKPVTAMVAMALVDDGVLALDEPVLGRVPWSFPPGRTGGFDPSGITLRRLLSHTAGLSVRGFGWVEPGATVAPRTLLDGAPDEARTLRLVASPGAELRYSGGGFALVQLLVEHATGTAFPVVARTRLLEPLGAVASGYEPSLVLSPRLATRHVADGRPLPRAGVASIAASGLVATASDLARLWAAVTAGPDGIPPGRGVLSPAACATLLAPHATDAGGATVGLGFYRSERHGELRYVHDGFDPGWALHAEGLLHCGATLVALCNGEGGRALADEVSRGVRHRLLDGLS